MLRYAITNRTLLFPLQPFANEAERQARLTEHCVLLARQGVDFIQLREKDLPEPALAQLATHIRTHIHHANTHTRLLLNAHPSLALSIGAQGVHLTANSPFSPAQVIALFQAANRPAPIVSVSCHTVDDVVKAAVDSPSIILFAPVFGKTVQGETVVPGTGLDTLAAACRAAHPIPVLALGGVTPANTAACLAAGAAGVAGIRLFL